MNTVARLIIIRHAESERNKALNGALYLNDPTLIEKVAKVPDQRISLTKRGISQAKQISKYLLDKIGVPDVVFHSGYTRTKQTTEGILTEYKKKKKLVFEVKENLAIRERDGGYVHTLLESEKNMHFPYLEEYWRILGSVFARPVGGESLIDVMEQRISPFIEKINREYAGKTVFLVTHGRAIQCMRFLLDEMTMEQMEAFMDDKKNLPKNCGVTIYEHNKKEKKLKLKSWNKVWWK